MTRDIWPGTGSRRSLRRTVLRAALVTFAGAALQSRDGAAVARAEQRSLPRPASLAALAARATRERRPVVALFSQHGCPYCEAIRREQLVHLLAEENRRGVIVVEFDVDDARPFAPDPATSGRARAAAGRSTDWFAAASPEALANALGVRLAPTVVFLGQRGELAERLVGYASRDFYAAYLDERIDRARAVTAR